MPDESTSAVLCLLTAVTLRDGCRAQLPGGSEASIVAAPYPTFLFHWFFNGREIRRGQRTVRQQSRASSRAPRKPQGPPATGGRRAGEEGLPNRSVTPANRHPCGSR